MDPKWLDWARKLQAIAQTGLSYPKDPFDVERYKAIYEIATEMMATQGNVDIGDVRALFTGEVGHATPKIDVRGAVFRDDAILMVRERSDGLWTLPGGWADIGEPPSTAVVREIYEESGYQTRAAKLLALYDRSLHEHPPFVHYAYKLFFRCELTGGKPTESIETDGVAFFREHELPELSLGRVTPSQIARLFEHYRNPAWPADFD
jgi:ADP-ribose pyrophosphatase YjhB (NUDIX family)